MLFLLSLSCATLGLRPLGLPIPNHRFRRDFLGGQAVEKLWLPNDHGPLSLSLFFKEVGRGFVNGVSCLFKIGPRSQLFEKLQSYFDPGDPHPQTHSPRPDFDPDSDLNLTLTQF